MFIDFCQPDPFCGLYCTSIGFTAGILSAQQGYIRVQLIPVYSAGAALGQTIEPVNRFFTAENTEAQPDLECLVGLDSATVSEVYKVLSNSSHTVPIIYWGSGLTFFTRCGATRRGTSVSNITARLPTVSTERTTSLNTTADSEPSSETSSRRSWSIFSY